MPMQPNLDRLNRQWRSAYARNDAFREWSDKNQLPRSWANIEQYQAGCPVMTREDFRFFSSAVRRSMPKGISWRSTGGSSAKPVVFPVGPDEQARHARAVWEARRWIGVRVDDPLLTLWGDAERIAGSAGKEVVRRLKDRVLGIDRISAYDLSEAALEGMSRSLGVSRAEYIVGYAGALDRWARFLIERGSEIAAGRFKVVIATAESFPLPDSRQKVEQAFGAPVRMEYGSAEAGVIAQEESEGQYRLMQSDYLYEYEEVGESASELLITALYGRVVPMFRYRTGDLVVANREYEFFRRVIGRCNDFIVLPHGQRIHSEFVSHIVRDLPGVIGYQVKLSERDRAVIQLRVSEEREELLEEVRRRLRRQSVDLQWLRVEFTDQLQKSTLGKQKFVLYD